MCKTRPMSYEKETYVMQKRRPVSQVKRDLRHMQKETSDFCVAQRADEIRHHM